MEKKKIDKVIEAFRNHIYLKEMMVANTAGTSGGFGSDASSPVAGRSPKIFLLARKFSKTYAKGGPRSRKNWLDYLNNK